MASAYGGRLMKTRLFVLVVLLVVGGCSSPDSSGGGDQSPVVSRVVLQDEASRSSADRGPRARLKKEDGSLFDFPPTPTAAPARCPAAASPRRTAPTAPPPRSSAPRWPPPRAAARRARSPFRPKRPRDCRRRRIRRGGRRRIWRRARRELIGRLQCISGLLFGRERDGRARRSDVARPRGCAN